MNACSSPRVQRQMRHGRCPSGVHSLLNTGSKLNTVHASWVSTFFYVEKPFHLCLAAIHSSIQMKQQGVGEHALGEPRVEWAAANHLPRKDSLTALHWVCKKEEKRSSPSECRDEGTPLVPIRKAGTRSLTYSVRKQGHSISTAPPRLQLAGKTGVVWSFISFEKRFQKGSDFKQCDPRPKDFENYLCSIFSIFGKVSASGFFSLCLPHNGDFGEVA